MSDSNSGPGRWQAPREPAPQQQNNTIVIVAVVVGVLLLFGVGGCVAAVTLARTSVAHDDAQSEQAVDEFDQNRAAVAGSDELGNTGTAEDPLPLGTEVDLANGWRVTVNSADTDADAAVAAANEFNELPPDAMRYVVVNLTAASDGNKDGTAEFPAIVTAVFGSAGIERNSSGTLPTPPDPRFDSVGELLPGGEATGNVVFEVGEDETDLVIRVQPVFSLDSSEAWFSLEDQETG